MKRLTRRVISRLSSARARLIFWNTVTFAVVLVSLGIGFRVLAERSLLSALDREIHLQAARFRDTQQIQMIVMRAQSPEAGMKTLFMATKRRNTDIVSSAVSARVRVINNVRIPAPDRSGQFLYRSFDLDGKPAAPVENHLPFGLPMRSEEVYRLKTERGPDYRPWDLATFRKAVRGQEWYAVVESAGGRLRVLSIPVRSDGRIVGVVQIASTLGQFNRDIAGLTRALLLVLPIALLVSVTAGIFLTGRALRPVKDLTRAAAGIRPEQLSRRLPVSGADEFDELASTFNGALERVETAFLDRERAIAQLRRFTADASHELRTPLTTIKANTGVALAEAVPSPEHIHALRQVDRAADRMTALVQDLLLLARSDAGQLALELHPVSLQEIVEEAIASLPVMPRAPISVARTGASDIVCGDVDHLRRLFVNLLHNAVRHTPQDGRISITIDRQGAKLVAKVSDTGCGIAPEHIPHIGQPFFRADAGRNRKYGGAGLGIAICHSIAAAHKASLDIKSSLESGTTVTVSFDGYRTLGAIA